MVAVNAVGEGRDVLAAELKVFGSEDQDHEHREQGQGNWKSCLFLRKNKLINILPIARKMMEFQKLNLRNFFCVFSIDSKVSLEKNIPPGTMIAEKSLKCLLSQCTADEQ